MLSGASNILNDLKTLSDTADSVICNSNHENEQVHCWFKKIKDIAQTIVKGTNSNTDDGESSTSSTSSFKFDLGLPNLVTLIEGEKSGAHRVSNLLAEVKKDHVRRSNRKSRKSRKSLRKIVLEKKSANRWEISNPEINPEDNGKKSDKNNKSIVEIEDAHISEIKDKLSDTRLKISFEANKSLKKKYLPDLSVSFKAKQDGDACCTPVQNNADQYLNTDSTPMTRSKIKILCATQIVKGKKSPILSSQCNPSLDSSIQPDNNIGKKSITVKIPSSDTSNNRTITIDSDEDFKTPIKQTKRKSSFQDSVKNAKKIKKADLRSNLQDSAKLKKFQREDSFVENHTSKRLKVSKDGRNPVIPAKTSNGFVQRNTSLAEKKILREIQKKEEIVSQNTKKIKSQRKMKIEESKKAREIKMEKALQQRLMIEKEKEERLKAHSHSTRANTKQKETHSKKKVPKKELAQEVTNKCPDKKEDSTSVNKQSLTINKTLNLRSNETISQTPSKVSQITNKQDFSKNNSNEDITLKEKPLILSEKKIYENNVKNATSTPIHTPVRPVRSKAQNATPVLPVKTLIQSDTFISKETTSENNTENSKDMPVENNDVFVKPVLNATFVSSPNLKDKNMKSPATKKVAFKENLAKTPVSNPTKKPISYPVTPLESSFVSYDVSEIKDDDDEDEEEENTKKPIPSWALGVTLRNALLNQHYSQIDTDELFGNYFETPDLGKIMGTRKKHYYKRTSSAIWIKSPDRSIFGDIS